MSHELARQIIQHQIDDIRQGGPLRRDGQYRVAQLEAELLKARLSAAQDAETVAELEAALAALGD